MQVESGMKQRCPQTRGADQSMLIGMQQAGRVRTMAAVPCNTAQQQMAACAPGLASGTA